MNELLIISNKISRTSESLGYWDYFFYFQILLIHYISEVLQIGENDSVIVMTHEPNWLLDWYWKETTGKNVSHLIQDYLNGRCKLRLAGDLHHFMRHSANQIDNPTSVQHLLVNGCGGAFLHPTHVFKNFEQFSGATYECKAAYPSFDDSSGVCCSL
jgi:hypothetical protein